MGGVIKFNIWIYNDFDTKEKMEGKRSPNAGQTPGPFETV
jgi:hypothetical protein